MTRAPAGVFGVLLATDRVAHHQRTDIADRLRREAAERPLGQRRTGPGIVQAERQRRKDLPAHVAWTDAAAGVAEAVEHIVAAVEPAEERQAGHRAIRRTVPAGFDGDLGELGEELPQTAA